MRDDAVSVIVCGSASALSIHDYLAELREHLIAPLRVLLTRSATRFVQPTAIHWYADELYLSDDEHLNPTELALRSACVVVLPTTANMLTSAALGIAATPAQTVLLSAPPPIVFFPAMNPVMWERPPVRRHVAALREDGHIVVDPVRREVFEFWDRRSRPGLGLPPVDHVRKVVLARLAAGYG